LTRSIPELSGSRRHCCAPLPLHVHRFSGVPLDVPPPGTFRHFPWIPTVPSGSAIHCCAPEFRHTRNTIAVPLTVELKLSVTHMPGTCDTTSPAGSVHTWFWLPSQEAALTLVPFAVLEPGSLRHDPDAGLTSASGFAPADGLTDCGYISSHAWESAPEHGYSLTTQFTAGLVRHLPWIRKVLSCA